MIPSRHVFEDHAIDYDRWFDEHSEVYAAQVRMLRAAIPNHGCGFEVGVGSGRFAVPFGIRCGIDPSRELIRMAKERGIDAVVGEGEHLPYHAGTFDYVLMMTVICFVDDAVAVLREVCRVLVPEGKLIVGFIEKDGEIATLYRNEKTEGRFLQYARFLTENEVIRFFHDTDFKEVFIIGRSRGFCVMIGQKE